RRGARRALLRRRRAPRTRGAGRSAGDHGVPHGAGADGAEVPRAARSPIGAPSRLPRQGQEGAAPGGARRVSPVASEGDFRLQSRAWLEAAVHDLPPAPRADDLGARREYDARWQQRLHEAGYAGLAWPVEHGGRGASAMEELVFHEEAERAGAPDVGVHFAGQNFIGPTIIVEGTREQRERYLPPLLRGGEAGC